MAGAAERATVVRRPPSYHPTGGEITHSPGRRSGNRGRRASRCHAMETAAVSSEGDRGPKSLPTFGGDSTLLYENQHCGVVHPRTSGLGAHVGNGAAGEGEPGTKSEERR